MVRKLKYHEQKLLKKVDFISWKVDNYGKENAILRKYHIKKREDYTKYNKLSRDVRELVEKIAKLDKSDPFKSEAEEMLMRKLYSMGVVNSTDLETGSKVSASAFCRRRLPVVMVKTKMSEYIKGATDLIEQGHVRVGTEMIKDPAFLVSRNLEDFITWVDGSKIKQHIMKYNNMQDDFEL
ncbi:U3 small nucleolar ribonucleoprotein protein IMP3 [Teleopsis dalmanni]|uniref:U3 small nucleolar ribonucleoprotein protein IMP3-like n=1 Tax=Teleopsis dalmanni TaxID=139649 RepID=UPI0018CDC4DD|nr:U3 small nucleolar ribonucleoprotein protein IMP3-like [Teleopsis dalmanni]XP_037947398.1 U3 small nucleolar ribonucleoprotein protein IMP3 [Teleopsis dalmanni]